ncbi:MAG: hypothetical protein R2815_13590 [Flavobacteriales bacterium]|nr:hypothetical protein [Flavobacteriales bacterium]
MKSTLACTLACAFLFTACSKEPGEGGKAEIRGIVYQQEYNDNTGQPVGTPIPAPEQRVYIIYGDGEYFDDDTRTGPDGKFRFPWLRKGSYKIYTYSECRENTCDGDQYAIEVTAEIGSRKDVVEIPLITVEWWH